jgi:O-methyltransferase involved in polyketide biosynthesis
VTPARVGVSVMSTVMTPKVDGSALTGVSETALLTLQVRANEARRADALIEDPMAVRLVDSIDFDFAKFGFSRRQDMALRAKAFDFHTRRYLIDHPKATVVALAEGLQTSFHRLDASDVGHEFRWLTVDLPPMIELRKKLLPPSDRVTMLAQSALDFSWCDHVDASDGVFITAEGLLMYLQPSEAMAIITTCAERFPGGQMMFDLPPQWLSTLTRRGIRASRRYRVPPMPFSMSVSQAADLARTVPGVTAVHDLPLPAGRGRVLNAAIRTVQRRRMFDRVRPVWTLLEFGQPKAAST